MRYAARTDGNLTAIVKAARKMGFLVYIANDDLCDAIAQLMDKIELWEIKTETGKFTDLQNKHRAAGWRIRTIRSVDDVLLARNEITFSKGA